MLRENFPSTTSYYKSCAKCFPGLLCTTKIAQSSLQYYFVLPRLLIVARRTTFYYKYCAKYFQYYVLQKLRQVLPRSALYYKACTKLSPVLLRTTKVDHSFSQGYFLLQMLREISPSGLPQRVLSKKITGLNLWVLTFLTIKIMVPWPF